MPLLQAHAGTLNDPISMESDGCNNSDDSGDLDLDLASPRAAGLRVTMHKATLSPRLVPRHQMSPRPRVLSSTEAAKCCEAPEFTIDVDMEVSARGSSRERTASKEVSIRSSSKERTGSRGWSTWRAAFTRQTSQGSTSSRDLPVSDEKVSLAFSKESSKSSTWSKKTLDLERHSVDTATLGEGMEPSCAAMVTLHVYNASWIGGAAASQNPVPLVHLGVEVYRREFSFGRFGVRTFKPGRYDESKHCCSLLLGATSMRPTEVYQLLLSLRDEYPPDRYRLIGCNCQTFAATFSERLGLGSGCIPEEYLLFAKPWGPVGGSDVIHMLQTGLHGFFGCGSFGLFSSCRRPQDTEPQL